MTKQELATRIWATANELRKNIKASEYKDYILGFMFYKYLSDKEISYLREKGGESEEDLIDLEQETITMIKEQNGYFIAYNDLFSVWRKKGIHLGAKDVSEAIGRFYDNIGEKHQRFFENIFSVLASGLTKLGENAGSRDSAVRSIIDLIWQIPPKSKEYDVLGYIYEYLIKQFSSEAKKDGAFYTPHGLTSLMAKIVADRLRDREEVSVYDPTLGTGGLLLNIGKEVGKFVGSENIRYYGQELITETCNLAKMNLFMQDIRIQKIFVRNGDTLKDDWPYFDEDKAYEALPVDAVVSNPPYSQGWNPENFKLNARFNYGLAPQKKADYAFLLHCLYHVKDKEGIMAIVLPHGVLFRGAAEYEIRKNLLVNHHIETIIGFPSNMFFATGIPVIVMILSKGRKEGDVLFIDASTSYAKEGTQNVLREMDIKRIVDTVKTREDIANFSKLVTLSEIMENDYNLNIPRYISATESKVSVEPYSVMTGMISEKRLSAYDEYWMECPHLKSQIFDLHNDYHIFKPIEIKEVIFADEDVKRYISEIGFISQDFRDYLISSLIQETADANVYDRIVDRLFKLYGDVKLLDSYSVFQAFSDEWDIVDNDLIRIHNEGKQICRETEPNLVLQRDNSTKTFVEVQKGVKGKIIPIPMIQQQYFKPELDKLEGLNAESSSLESEIEDLWNELEDESKSNLSKNDSDDNSKMDNKKVSAQASEILSGLSFPDTDILEEYLKLKKRQVKIDFIYGHTEIEWTQMKPNKDMTYGAGEVKSYIELLKFNRDYDTDSEDGKIVTIQKKIRRKGEVMREMKSLSQEIENKAIEKMGNLTDIEVDHMLVKKWIDPVMNHIEEDVKQVMMKLVRALEGLREQYKNPLPEIDRQIEEVSVALGKMLDELCGDSSDMKAIDIFREGLF
ncbi:type I restriction-modification system subunit M [Sporofaciens musculi]|uniref:type I restriction-modification system subunit M n=1 Tax=Sporofaciens musculi TaxID=2681861 RepID=UPI00259FFC09|nr:type I restriction-modification system subunit M [Sporofaciens musculi]